MTATCPQIPLLDAAGASWRFESWPQAQADGLLGLWAEGFAPVAPAADQAVPLRVVYDAALIPPADDSATLVSDGRVRISRTKTDWWLQAPDLLARIPADRSAAFLRLGEGFAQRPLKVRQSALLLPMLWLLQAAGRTVLHAAAVLDPADGAAVLLAGTSGSGKSTTVASLCEAGWRFIADDISVCRIEPAAAWVWPLARGLSLGGPARAESSGWRRLDAQPCEGKILLEPPQVASGPGPLAAVVLPRVTGAAHSVLRRLGAADAIARLLPAAGGVTLEPQIARHSLDALGWLGANIPVHELQLGRDTYQDAARLCALLRQPAAPARA